MTLEQAEAQKSIPFTLLSFRENLNQLKERFPVAELYEFLSSQHEHFYPDPEAMEADLTEILENDGTIIVGIDPTTQKPISFLSCQPLLTKKATYLIGNNLTSIALSHFESMRIALELLKDMGKQILKHYPDCDYLCHSIRPSGSPNDQMLAQFYTRLGFQPEANLTSDDPNRTVVSISREKIETLLEGR